MVRGEQSGFGKGSFSEFFVFACQLSLYDYYVSSGEGRCAHWKPQFTWELRIEVERQGLEWILLALLVNTVINVVYEVCMTVKVYIEVL